MDHDVRARVGELEAKIEEIKKEVNKTLRDIKNINQKPTNKLRTERATITKSILEASQFLNINKTKSTMYPRRLRSKEEDDFEL